MITVEPYFIGTTQPRLFEGTIFKSELIHPSISLKGVAMEPGSHLDLGVDPETIRSFDDYKAVWKRLAPVSARMIEKNEQCRHNVGDRFVYSNHYDKPPGICSALHHVLQLYLWRVSIGFPSWEDDPTVYRIHCPDKKGTVWELKRVMTSEGKG